MKALTIWQPWAWAIVCADKRVENRPWRPPQSALGQRIAIHAGKRPSRARDEAWLYNEAGLRVPREMPHGAIVGTAIIGGCIAPPEVVTRGQRVWACGPWCWLLDDVCALAEPIPCRGAQGLWDVPAEIARRIAP